MRWLTVCALLALTACKQPQPTTPAVPFKHESSAAFHNPEPTIPPQCYTKTAGTANPCWACHTTRNGRNYKSDWSLQEEYAFSEPGQTNHWQNLFTDRRAEVVKITDADTLRYIREDNYTPLFKAVKPADATMGYQPDLDYAKGFDTQGFARDGSGWRAFRYKPFPGVFWPSNGATDDVLIRLPARFRRDAAGRESMAIYRINLALLEAAMTVADSVADADLTRRVEMVDERLAGFDLDGDGKRAEATRIKALPAHYAGAAAGEPLRRWRYPTGTEFLHGVRYVDPDAPNLLSTRLKELRYSTKQLDPDDGSIAAIYKEEAQEKLTGRVPTFPGTPELGLLNRYGWIYKGWIENAQGQLRAQTLEEHYACMGCHGGIGITVDSSFALPRKPPGEAGWGWQSIAGMLDAPMAGHQEPEILTWFRRTGGGDEFRNNAELLARFFPKGELDVASVRRAATGGDKDILWLLAPSRERALTLNKTYWALVKAQNFAAGRDVVVLPPVNVFDKISNGDTELRAKDRVYSDGRLWLDWPRDPSSRR